MILKYHVVAMGVKTNVYTIFVAIPDGKNQLWSLKRRWEYNTEKKGFVQMGWKGVDWVHLGRKRNLWTQQCTFKFQATVSISRRYVAFN